ncbi:4-(cytidine 5'-diphospho)-2-C-methyl-D-erythritol kinase [Planctomyces sp. SH-PL62]|uniref:4-(cytidine 5'-diphospho)-2-C-methyl-D-erythritol kinase n=1 Tax=Planctomyces sp. SH-PL62 TaxID=1636152 RepID=UPI00078DB6A5|nr:4-(cytidine 5'-diphospho)-2-C-methyl-D-erythritol kinase [Planctomyces sp. SH-PL62]AMV38866.1 4-diphosphocytidyl-2-C-methyl-D-erythritol kinase [Planctomyces sp. SH-PL62]
MILRSIAGGVEVLAPAKLNLFLEVAGRRPDGYHEIESLMVEVDLFDRLTFREEEGGAIALTCDDPSLPVDGRNLVVRAAELLRSESGCRSGARIDLKKSIPAQAGLAGGSSDAAATLAALDRLWNLGTPPGRLAELAGRIGSDVAFFLQGPSAVCRGRGERVEAVSLPIPLHFVLIAPEVGLSTADVYQRLKPPEQSRSIVPALAALAAGDPVDLGRSLFNRLQPVAESIRPELAAVRDALADLGPLLCGSLMSGSGSAYFGLVRDSAAAERAAHALNPLGLGSVRVVTCGP